MTEISAMQRSNQNDTIWTDELVLRLNEMRAKGFSARVIAEEFNISRNAVIGKCYRLGLSSAEIICPWKLEEEEHLKILWSDAERIADIAIALNKQFGNQRTAKSVGLKVRRLGLFKRRKKNTHSNSFSLRKFVPVRKRSIPIGFEPLKISFLEISQNQCREVVGRGDNGLVIYCGHETVADYSDCLVHYNVNRMTLVAVK